MPGGVLAKVFGVAEIPLTVMLEDRGRIIRGVIVNRVNLVAVDRRVVRIQGKGAVVAGNGFVELTLFLQYVGEVIQNTGGDGPEFYGSAVCVRSVGKFGLPAIDETEGIVDFRMIGIDLQRPAQGDDRLVQFSLLAVEFAEIMMGFDQIGTDLKSSGIGDGGGIVIAAATEGVGEIEVIGRIVGLNGNRFLDQIDGGGVSSCLKSDEAEAMKGVGVIGVLSKNLLIEGFRFGQTPCRVMLQGGFEGRFDGK